MLSDGIKQRRSGLLPELFEEKYKIRILIWFKTLQEKMSASEETKEPAESKTVEKMAEDEVILHNQKIDFI